jgi:hypothetical protein
MSAQEDGCTFGKVLEQKVFELQRTMDLGFRRLELSMREIKEENKQMFNHMSSRPTERDSNMKALLIGIICSLVGVMGGFMLKILF